MKIKHFTKEEALERAKKYHLEKDILWAIDQDGYTPDEVIDNWDLYEDEEKKLSDITLCESIEELKEEAARPLEPFVHLYDVLNKEMMELGLKIAEMNCCPPTDPLCVLYEDLNKVLERIHKIIKKRAEAPYAIDSLQKQLQEQTMSNLDEE